MPYFSYRLNRIAARSTTICFVLSSLLFLSRLTFTSSELSLFILFFCFVIIAMYAILIPTLIIHSLINYKDFEEHISTFTLIFLNISIGYLYIILN